MTIHGTLDPNRPLTSRPTVAQQAVFHTAGYPSHIVLPITPSG